MQKLNLFSEAAKCLAVKEVEEKLILVQGLYQNWQAGKLRAENPDKDLKLECGIPVKPELVTLNKLKTRRVDTKEGHAALIHSIAHIEFSAINLALDALARFRQMPQEYYADWIRIADEERQHFMLLRQRLNKLGYDYGDFPAHGGLWRVAEETAKDVLLRMALVPRVLEARGLDVTPGIIDKFKVINDSETVKILNRIFTDEITYVAAGNRWFRHVCDKRDLEPETAFIGIIKEEFKGKIKGPFAIEARLKAGFSKSELEQIKKLAG